MDYGRAAQIMAAHAETIDRSHGAVRRHNTKWKKLGNRTWLVREPANNDDTPDVFALRYFQSEIIRFFHDHVEIDTGGFFSFTTLQRLNEYMPSGFRIYGRTFRPLRRVLGFVRTPNGTYPFSGSMSFSYGGHTLEGHTRYAEKAVAKLPAYVGRFVHEICSFPKQAPTASTTLPDEAAATGVVLMRNWISWWVRQDTYHVRLVEEVFNWMDQYRGVHSEELRTILSTYGAEPFNPRSKAKEMEYSLMFNRKLPRISKKALKRHLKQNFYEYIINCLGFKQVEWNRR